MGTDDVTIVHEALMAKSWRHVAPALGIHWRGDRIKCPIHHGDGTNFTLDDDGTRLTFICASQCGAGDVLELIQKLRDIGFKEALQEAADIAGVQLDDGSEQSEEDRARRAKEREAYREAALRRAQEPKKVKPYPDAREVSEVWDAALAVTSDAEVSNYLASRAISPNIVAARDLMRVIGPGAPLPSWAMSFRRDELENFVCRSWLQTGHRLIIRTWDHTGAVRGLRGWRVGGDEETPKRLGPANRRTEGTFWANYAALDMLQHQAPGTLVICEGEPDAIVWMCRGSYAVIGITSGSWTADVAARVAVGSEVIIRTHLDDAGKHYSKLIEESLKEKAQLWRRAS